MKTTSKRPKAKEIDRRASKVLAEAKLGPQQRRILKYLAKNPGAYTHDLRQACCSGNPTHRMRELCGILKMHGLHIFGRRAPITYRNKFGERNAVFQWSLELV